MNKLILLLILICQLSIVNSSAQTYMNIYQSNGQVLQIDISTIDSITYSVTTPGTLATITTTGVTGISGPSALSGGNITADGGSTISHRGVCWATTTNPTTANDTTLDGTGTGTGSYTSTLTGLSANTTYYVRAYAINSAGTAYGNEVSFTTGDIYTMGSGVTDIDGNFYPSIILGTQEWMQQNLRVSRFANGDSIPNGAALDDWLNGGIPYRTPTTGGTIPWGQWYNPYTVRDSRNACPTGWHVPSNTEWLAMFQYLDPTYTLTGGSETAGKMLMDSLNWPFVYGNNASGFSAVGAGSYTPTGDNIPNQYTAWWSSNYTVGFLANDFWHSADTPNLNFILNGGAHQGLSVRCVKD